MSESEKLRRLAKNDSGHKRVHKPGASRKQIKALAREAGVTTTSKAIKTRKPRTKTTAPA